MDRRSWLWRRRSSEKSLGETESSGGSVSSHSERFSDDQVYSNQSFQSSKAEAGPDGGIEALSEKLSEALLNISTKEELVNQHAKVAEEAVQGWEKAENEVFALRQQLEVLTLKNSTLEDRVGHLDGALKECLRQLRQTRDEKEQNVHEATETKSELESQIADLRSQLRSAETETSRLELAEEENSALKLEVSSMAEELEIRLIERELSNRAAEQASKLHLESIKKAARFEAECRRLRKASNERRSFTDSQSDTCERISMEFESSRTTPSVDMKLMDDFLEMERLAALPESGQSVGDPATIKHLKSELEAAKETLKKAEAENVKLTTALKEREAEVKTLRIRVEEAESKVVETGTRLAATDHARSMTEKELESTKETVKALREQVKREEMQAVEVRRRLDTAQVACTEKEAELEASRSTVVSLEALYQTTGAKCRELENEVSRLQSENQRPNTAKQIAELRIKQDMELAVAGSKFSECQETIASLGRQLKALATLEDVLIDGCGFRSG